MIRCCPENWGDQIPEIYGMFMQKTTMLKGEMVTNDDEPLHFGVPHRGMSENGVYPQL